MKQVFLLNSRLQVLPIIALLFSLGVVHDALAKNADGSRTRSNTQWVDPLIGTDGTGHVFPGASVPFGMVAPGPDQASGGWDYTSGYQYKARKTLGFSNTHISGAGIPELGDVLLQPCTGLCWTEKSTNFASTTIKATEQAQPGYYSIRLAQHKVKVELTATQRVALQRYSFGKVKQAQVLVDLQHGLQYGDNMRVLESDVQVDQAASEIRGTVKIKGWTERQASFVVHFDQAIAQVLQLPARAGEKAPRFVLTFHLPADKTVLSRISLSTVDVDGARKNMREAEGKNFDTVRQEADAQWANLLSRIDITAPAKQKRIFYSSLYRTLLHPSDIADSDGRVRGPNGSVLQARGGHYYSTLSLWDTFRAVHPLLTIIVPERVDGFIQTLLDHHQQQGYLPLWTAWGQETWTMIGNPALPVIADAVAKGFKGFDQNEALQAMIETSTAKRPNAAKWAQQNWTNYDTLGYLPFDKEDGEAVSKTLEYGVGDDAVARVATMLGKPDVADRFKKRAQGYQQLFDNQTQTMRGKDSKGAWRSPFNPITPTSPLGNPGDYTEANAYQYTLTPALHDPEGLMAQLGGRKGLEQWLDRFFTLEMVGANKHEGQEALIGQYAHGNEPSHHITYLYAYTDAPWKGQNLVQRIVRDFYTDKPNGIIGNDDCGQMSAWYVLSTLGFYPVVPASGNFVLGAPQVSAARLTLPEGQYLSIIGETSGNARALGKKSTFASGAKLNNQLLNTTAFPYHQLMQGGELAFNYAPIPKGRLAR